MPAMACTINTSWLPTVISSACTINIIDELYNGSKVIIDDSIVTLQFVASLTDDSRGVIYDCNIFIIQATDAGYGLYYKHIMIANWRLLKAVTVL
jgi:hypothetical protein